MKNLNKKGWVRLHRKIVDNDIWFMEKFTKGQAWIDLFLNANHKDNKICIRGNIITIKRGQIGWSELTMCKRWGWSKNKTRRYLKWLETEQQIVQQKDRYITTIITILRYEEYQSDTETEQQTIQQKDSRRYSRRYINKNDKNDKNVKNDKNMQSEIAIKNVVFNLFYNSINPDINFANMTNRKAEEWLIKKYGLDDIKKITQYAISIQGEKYAPTITTPYQLKEKISQLKIYNERQKTNKIIKLD